MAIIMNGLELRNKKLALLKEKVTRLNPPIGLVVISVGNDSSSKVYVNNKALVAKDLGYTFIHESLKEDIEEEELISIINNYNKSDLIDGIIVQMPMPKHLNVERIQNAIDPYKDVDGLTYVNQGKLLEGVEALTPCTPKGIIDLLDEYKIELEGAKVTVIGRSILVGKPLSIMLTNRNASVSLLHSKTKNIKEYTKNSDIIVVAVGQKHFLTADMVKDGCIIVDVGITRIDNKIYGDVDFAQVNEKASHITPVPKGVGPMTVYELMENTYKARILRRG